MPESTVEPLKAIAIALEQYKLDNKFLTINFMEEDCETLLNRLFALIYYKSEQEFYISFCLNSCTLFDASFFTHEVSLLLQEKLLPYTEHYVDTKELMLYFGEQAHTKYKQHVDDNKKLKQCPLCERYYPDELFQDENDFCLVCNKVTLPNATFH